MYFLAQCVVMFAVGCSLSVAIHLLHLEWKISKDTDYLAQTPSWVPVTCGASAIFIGRLYPAIDTLYSSGPVVPRGWSTVLRCIIGFLGIAYASAKLPFETHNIEMSCAMAVMAVWVWWIADRSTVGFSLSFSICVLGTATVQLLAYRKILSYNDPDFFLVRSWLPALLFSAGTAFGSLGRQLKFDQDTSRHTD